MAGSRFAQQIISRGNSQISSDVAMRGSSVPDCSTAGGTRAQETGPMSQATVNSNHLAIRPHGSASYPVSKRLANFFCCRTSLHELEGGRAVDGSINNGIAPKQMPQQGVSADAQSSRAEVAAQQGSEREQLDPDARIVGTTLQSLSCHSQGKGMQVSDQDATTNVNALANTKPCSTSYHRGLQDPYLTPHALAKPIPGVSTRDGTPDAQHAYRQNGSGMTLHSSETNVPGVDNGNAKPEGSYALRPSWEPFLTDLQPATNQSKSEGLPILSDKGANVLQQTQQHQAKLKLRQRQVAAKLNVEELSSWDALRFLSGKDISRDTSPLGSRSDNKAMHTTASDQEVSFMKLPPAERKTHLLKVLQEAALPLSEANKGQRRLSAPVSTQSQPRLINQGRAMPSPWRPAQLPVVALSDVANVERAHGSKVAEDDEGVQVEGFPEDDEVHRRLTFTRLLPVELDEDIDSCNSDFSINEQQQDQKGGLERCMDVVDADGGSDIDEFWDARSHASTASWCSAMSATSTAIAKPQNASRTILTSSKLTSPDTHTAQLSTTNIVQCKLNSVAVYDPQQPSPMNHTPHKASVLPFGTVPSAAIPSVTGTSDLLFRPDQSSRIKGAQHQNNTLQFPNIVQALSVKPSVSITPSYPSNAPRHAFHPHMYPPKLIDEPAGKPRHPFAPNKPIMFIDPATQWQPFPVTTSLSGYWAKISKQSSPTPMPIDEMLGASWVARKAHESIQGIKIGENDTHFIISARVSMLGTALIHKEMYRKDGGVERGNLRRDVKPGRVEYKAYYTTNNEVVLVVESFTMSGQLDSSSVEVIRLEDGTGNIHCDQACFCWRKKKAATQQFVGQRQPLPKHH